MNLLQFQNNYFSDDENIDTIENYRQNQYNLIKEFCHNIILHLSRQNNNYLIFDPDNDFIYNQRINYYGINNSLVDEIKLKIINKYDEDKTDKKDFLTIWIPTLLDSTYFFLNGNTYVPSIYIVDYPISIKKKSIKIWSLFNSITFHNKDSVCVFAKKNIPLDYILSLFLLYDNTNKEEKNNDLNLYKSYINNYKIDNLYLTESKIINFFKKNFKQVSTIQEIIDLIESLFFDNYTTYIYSECYSDLREDLNIRKIIKKALYSNYNEEIPNFIDLKYKRLIFLELLFGPLLERVANLTLAALKGFRYDFIKIDSAALIKFFLASPDKNAEKIRKGLAGNYLYDNVNLYSGILKHKVNMVAPGIKNPPAEIRSLHNSHFEKICPISVHNKDIGNVVSIVYNTKISESGIFL